MTLSATAVPSHRSDPDSVFRRAEIVASASCRWPLHPSYMHSFCMTPGHIVLVEQPLAVSTVQVCRTLLNRQPLVAALRWFDEPVSGKWSSHGRCLNSEESSRI